MRHTKKALSNFRAKVGQATDGILGGFIESDGTVDFVPFTAHGFHGHNDALRSGVIPEKTLGGFSLVVKKGKVMGWNFDSMLNGEAVRLPAALEKEVRAALDSVCEYSEYPAWR